MQYSTQDIDVVGGKLRVGRWESQSGFDPSKVILAIHGVTSHHLAWQPMAEMLEQYLPGFSILAPDLRGRGRSSGLPLPYGMSQHAQDLAAILDQAGVPQATIIGHSMGAFVSLFLQTEYPELVQSVLLVDGGMPIAVPGGLTGPELLNAVLGPTAERLNTIFPDTDSYIDYWKQHPSFAEWSSYYEAYVAYDLNPVVEGFKPATNYDAMAEDSADLYGSEKLMQSLDHINQPTMFVRAPRGLFAEPPGLYPNEQIKEFITRYPDITFHEVEDVDHYAVVMHHDGLKQVLPLLKTLIATESTKVSEASAALLKAPHKGEDS